jgi:hypothetical protein
MSIYRLGYVFGPLALGPLSEVSGWRWTMIPSFMAFYGYAWMCISVHVAVLDRI